MVTVKMTAAELKEFAAKSKATDDLNGLVLDTIIDKSANPVRERIATGLEDSARRLRQA